jgi:hypothetical protein
VLINHHYFGLIVGFCPCVYGGIIEELYSERGKFFDVSLEKLIEGVTSDA